MTNNTTLKLAVNAFYDYQAIRIAMGGRLKIKKDGEDQIIPEEQQETWAISEKDKAVFMEIYDDAVKQEKRIEAWIKRELKDYRIYTEYLKNVKGVGPIMAAVIISEYDIERATTVSKMWQYTGLNPGQVAGKVKKDGEIITTEDMIRGDRLTVGYLAPFNQWLRTKMCGVLAGSFIKCQSPYALIYYYPYKARLEQEQNTINGSDKKWCDEKAGHRDKAAKRYMIKMFLKDLYVAWRIMEGLEVRKPYQEEYLGHQHIA
jgi:hypothetical protein